MENVKYYKDLNHNYLIIKDRAREAQSYQHKMITTNKMRHFLACKIRYVDQECHFYYEISSRQNMACFFDGTPMDYGNLKHLFEYIKEALDELDNYLLNSRGLLLQPEYIFRNPETEEYFFLYYPYYEEEGYMPLAEFLVERVDHAQEEAVSLVYKIYEMAQDNQFIISEILALFAEDMPEVPESIEVSAHMDEEQDMDFFGSEDFSMESAKEKEEAPKHLMAAGILSAVCAAAAAAVFGIRYFYTLSIQETAISTVGSIILTIMAAGLFVYLILNICGMRKHWKKDRKYTKGQGAGEPIAEREEPLPLDSAACVYEGGTVPAVPGTVKRKTRDISGDGREYGNTVFLETAVCKTEHKLYGTNKGNKYHIDLAKLPCTVGKLAGSVDVVIKDSTISRIHARFTRQKEGIFVTDMNSTNGTFKNGLRLEPNETVLIEQGDELRFGRMTFCYR